MIKVKVKDGMIGYYHGRRYGKGLRSPDHPGDEFDIPPELFSSKWMKRVSKRGKKKTGAKASVAL